MKNQRLQFVLFTLAVAGAASLLINQQPVTASPVYQDLPTGTPLQVVLPTALPILPTTTPLANVVPIERTPTPEGAAYLEAITEANVRSQADPESERLGTIRAGEQYTVIGRYFRWYQFQYSQSASGTGWVFDELVNVSGNINNIPDLSATAPTPDVAAIQSIGTLAQITQTPGGVLTATANVGVVPLPLEANGSASVLPQDLIATVLPTFTVPANVAAPNTNATSSEGGAIIATPQLIQDQSSDIVLPSRIPPIVPILLLGGAGMLGLLISSSRR